MNFKRKLFFYSLAFCGCVTQPQKKSQSEWTELAHTEPVECQLWPLKEKELEVKSLIAMQGSAKRPAFIASIRQRNAGVSHELLEFEKISKIDFEATKQVLLKRGDKILSLWKPGTSLLVVIAVRAKDGRFSLEIRKAETNQVIGKSSEMIEYDIQDEIRVVDGKDLWLTLRTSEFSSHFFRITSTEKETKIVKLPFESSSRGATLMVDRKTHLPYLFELRADANQVIAHATSLNTNLTLGPKSSAVLDKLADLESWSITRAGDGFYVAAISGDSMVGQSKLHVILLNFANQNLVKNEHRIVDMPDAHVAEPFWISSNQGNPFLMLAKWLDGETTVQIGRVGKGELKSFANQGVLPQGSIVVDGMEAAQANSVWAVIRSKESNLWQYRICKFNL